jgi:hypothetical protein
MVTKKGTLVQEKLGKRHEARDEDFDYDDRRDPEGEHKMPWFGWLGLAILIVSELALWIPGNPLQQAVATAFTPIMWTGYLLLIDGWIWERGYYSYFKNAQREWPMLLLFSVLIWVMFETFNFPAHAWTYQNMPKDLLVKGLVFAWAYATIIPALLRTRTFLATFDFFDRTHPWNFRFTPMVRAVFFIVGMALTFLPPMFPACTADKPWCTSNLLIPLVWLGFIFMIEPINYRLGAPSVLRDLEKPKDREIDPRDLSDRERRPWSGIVKPVKRNLEKRDTQKAQDKQAGDNKKGKISFFWQILVAGLVCGLFWETWNFQAANFGHNGLAWDYWLNPVYHICVGHSNTVHVPDPNICAEKIDLKIGKMPILGFLGYPPFIWECFALWELAKWAMHGDIWWKARLKPSR